MPVPHFNIKITQRSKGNSAVAGAAYQAGEKLFSEYDQKTKNYTCKKEVVYTEIMLPPNAPPEYADRATLWNSVEEIEKQWNGKESLYYGLNALSNNLIMVDRKKLKNPNGLILGTPGSGKSFSAKREICNAFLVTDDDIIICDPECEVRHEVA